MINFYDFYKAHHDLDSHDVYSILGEISHDMHYMPDIDVSDVIHIIRKDAKLAFLYASNIIKGRWPEGEDVILKSPSWSYSYSRYVIRGRWLEAEPTIMTSSGYTYWYAKDVMGFRWIEAEEYLKSLHNSYFWCEYQRLFGITSGV